MKLRCAFLLCASLALIDSGAAVITSPNGKLVVSTSVNDEGTPCYSVTLDGKTVITDAPLGLVTDFADLSKGLQEKGVKTEPVKRSYEQDKIKKSHVDVDATRAIVSYGDGKERKIDIEFHVADGGLAFRYNVPRQSERGSMVVKKELSSFAFPDGTTTFLSVQSWGGSVQSRAMRKIMWLMPLWTVCRLMDAATLSLHCSKLPITTGCF